MTVLPLKIYSFARKQILSLSLTRLINFELITSDSQTLVGLITGELDKSEAPWATTISRNSDSSGQESAYFNKHS